MNTFKLSEPIVNGSETIREFELQPLKAKHIRNISANPNMSELLDVVGKMCAQPKHIIDELSAQDALELTTIVGKSLGGGRAIGEVASES